MIVGVPETDVFTAADAVFARGERPTVERVRAELGRGSQARVGALLDQWWEQLARRLRGQARLSGLPVEVEQAFITVWQQATAVSASVAEDFLADQRQVLSDEREALVAQQERARMDVDHARQQVAEAVAARKTMEARQADLERLLAERQSLIDDLCTQREELIARRNEGQQQLSLVTEQMNDRHRQAEQSRQELQRYSRDVENRAYRELDRVREENKGLASQLKEAEGRLQAMQELVLSVQRDLADAREQREIAQLQLQGLQRGQEQSTTAQEELTRRCQALEEKLLLAHREVASNREQAIVAQARADALFQQLAKSKGQRGKASAARPSKN
ncbi:DNA-binding protein [Pseudomonas japonica]|uniref:Replication region DNA-binding N-term n=1 Tax=Pseudomonas japonica TaxID=256466 RepID=A0A239I473_9PSED|nr:DNA-binding protein [Pseudomonas japonica]SNS88281.1 replication region DNA-binding N-term [Pseudomonas japonica]